MKLAEDSSRTLDTVDINIEKKEFERYISKTPVNPVTVDFQDKISSPVISINNLGGLD